MISMCSMCVRHECVGKCVCISGCVCVSICVIVLVYDYVPECEWVFLYISV